MDFLHTIETNQNNNTLFMIDVSGSTRRNFNKNDENDS